MKTQSLIRLIVVGIIISIAACQKLEVERKNKVATLDASNVTSISATLNGILIDKGKVVSDWGFCYNTTGNPDLSSEKVSPIGAPAKGKFEALISNLDPNVTYYYRAFATGEESTAFGEIRTFGAGGGGNPDISLTVPELNETWHMGETKTISWNYSGSENIDLLLYKEGKEILEIVTNISNNGFHNWEIPTLQSGIDYQILIRSTTNHNIFNQSNNFEILGVIDLSEPTLNDTWYIGGTKTIKWNYTGSDNVNIFIRKGGDNIQLLASNIENTGEHIWTIPSIETGADYLIYIESTTTSKVSGLSDLFKIAAIPVSVTDIDGNSYNTVLIGSQVWIAENLKTTKFNDGTGINNVTDNTAWSTSTDHAYCWHDNDVVTYKNSYGAYYNFYAVATGKLCPTGWHVPTNDEWKELETSLGMSEADADNESEDQVRGTNEGSKLIDLNDWGGSGIANDPEKGTSGFSAIRTVYRESDDGEFPTSGNYYANWWSSTEFDNGEGIQRGIIWPDKDIKWYSTDKKTGISVRCIKN